VLNNIKLCTFVCIQYTLYNILVNTSRYLPENYEWFAGSKYENLYLYYDMVKVAIVGDTYSIRLILNVPLNTANCNFVLYKLIVFPMPVLNNTFFQYNSNFLYFGFNEIQHSNALITEAEINRCIGSSVAMCPADREIYTTKVVTCGSRLIFQTLDAHKLCHRQIFLHRTEPVWTSLYVVGLQYY
jgi:hypothetical protein